MSNATVVGLAEAIKSLIVTNLNDSAGPFDTGLSWNVMRVTHLKQWIIADNDQTVRVRVATLGTDGGMEEARLSVGVKYIIPILVIRKLDPNQNQGEGIDEENSEVRDVADKMSEFVEIITQTLSLRENIEPSLPGLWFEKWTHRDRSNPDGLIFDPAGLSERRQYESRIFLHYRAEFGTT